MGFSEIIRAIDNEVARADTKKVFAEACDAWFSYTQKLSAFGVLLGGDSVAAVRLARRIAERAEFSGKLWLIGAGSGLAGQLPFFRQSGEFQFQDGAAKYKMELISAPPPGLELILSRDGTLWETEKISCSFFLNITPYGSEKWSYAQFTAETGQRVTDIFDHLYWAQPYALLPLYLGPERLKTIPAPIREYWKKAYPKAVDCERLAELCQSALVLPVEQGSEGALLLLGLAALRLLREDRAIILADFSGAECRVLRMFAERPQEKWADLLAELYPSAVPEQVKRGLITPLSGLHAELAGKLHSIHFVESLSKTSIEPGHLYACALQDAPEDYRNAVYAQAGLPAFCDVAETACAAMSAGLPFLCARQGAYSTAHGAVGAAQLKRLSAVLTNDLSLYLNAADLLLAREVEELTALMQEAASGTDTMAMRYFRACGAFAERKENQRLEQGAALAYAYTMQPVHQLTAADESEQEQLEALYYRLVSCIEDGHLLLSRALPGSRAAQYLDALSEGGVFCPEIKAENIMLNRMEPEEPGQEPGGIMSVTAFGARARIGGENFTMGLQFTGEDTEPLTVVVNGLAEGVLTLDGMPWLKFVNAGFALVIPESGGPVSERFEADLKDTGLHVFMAAGADGSHRMQGMLSEPLTAMDAIYALAGGVDFVAVLPEELQKLGGIGLESVMFQLDAQNSLTQMEFTLTTKNAWTLWERDGMPLITLVPRLGVAITSPQDLQGRRIMVSVAGDCAFGTAGTLRLFGSYPPFTLGMTLLSPLDIGELLRMFGVKPPLEANVTVLDVFTSPETHYYLLRAVVEGDWRLCEQFSIGGLGLELVSAGESVSLAFSGLMSICTVQVGASVRYNTGAGWSLLARINTGGGLKMSNLVATYGGNLTALPNDTQSDPLLGSLAARYATGSGEWSITATVTGWEIGFLHMTVDARATVGQQAGAFLCKLDAELCWNSIELSVGYSYVRGQNSFYFKWGSFSGRVENNMGTLILRDFSLGDIVSEMVGWVTGTPFGLEAPWDVLDSIRLNELTLTYNFGVGEVSMQVIAELNLGFASVTGVRLKYGVPQGGTKKEVQVTLLGEFPWNTGEDALGGVNELGPWDAATPGASPVPDGKGNAYFDLQLLALGQRAGLFATPPLTVAEAVAALEQYDPERIPAYDPATGWIVGAEFGLLRDSASKAYFMNARLLFCDPSLFALHITLDSAAAKLFQGLSFEILYSKLSDTIGLYKACITLPTRMRYFSIGAYSLALPCFSVEIYTNGDFKIDVGFPQRGDFSRSFAISGQIGVIPFLGAAGIFFGKLSSATAASSGIILPHTSEGLFNPALVFGIGLRLGIGKMLDAGILKAGFSLTFTAILEGVYAKFNPYRDAPVEWYYAVTGTAGIHGAIYGSIDFVILAAAINVEIGMDVSFAINAYRASAFEVSAYIRAAASLTINFGLFKIKISFSFSLHVKESFTIGSNSQAPWDAPRLVAAPYTAQVRPLDFSHLASTGKALLPAQLALALTVAADDWGTEKNSPCAVALMTLSSASFTALAEKTACWAVAAILPDAVEESALRGRVISEEILLDLSLTLASGTLPAWQEVDAFLSRFFTVAVEDAEKLMAQDGEVDGIVFPLSPALILTPEEEGVVKRGYKLDDYSRVSPEALVNMRKEFDRLAVAVEAENGRHLRDRLADAPELSMAQWLLTDYFLLLARQAVKCLLTEAQKGKRPLGELLDTLKSDGVWGNVGGMASRYQLHGLRIPTAGITAEGGGSFPPELGIHSLCGAQQNVTTTSAVWFAVGSECAWLKLPAGYRVAVDTALASSLEQWAQRGFSPNCTYTSDGPSAIPLMLSFGKPFPLDKQTAWSLPENLPRDRGRFTLQCFAAGEDGSVQRQEGTASFAYAALVEFNIKKTDVRNVFVITGASEHAAVLLAEVVRQQLPVLNCRLVGAECGLLAAVQMDLSTQTHPPVARAGISPWPEFLKILWEAFVTNNGGYALAARPKEPFPDSMWNDGGEGVFTLVITYESARVPLESPAVNAVLADAPVGEGVVLAAVAETAVSVIAPAAENTQSFVNAGWTITRGQPGATPYADTGEELLDSGYTLLRYGIEGAGGFPASGGSLPVGPNDAWHYGITVPTDTYLNGGDYAAAGRELSVWLEWLDPYGNRLPRRMWQSANCGYMDALLGFSRYPGVTTQWEVTPQKGLCITLLFDAGACAQQEAAPAAYRRICAQLGDPHGVELTLLSPIFPGPVPFGKADHARLQAWVEEIRHSLSGTVAPGALELCFALPVQTDVRTLFALSCAVQLSRTGAPATGFESVENVRSVMCELPLPQDIPQFAFRFEAALPALRVLKGREQLFALCVDQFSLHFEAGSLRVFAPRPVSNMLRAESGVALYRYETGKGLSAGDSMAYTGVDLNVWLKNALALTDAAFTPRVAGAAAALKTVNYSALLAAKKALAEQISSLLSPMLAEQPHGGLERAREEFRQRLLSRLSNLYEVRAAITAGAELFGGIENARLYGVLDARSEACGITLSPIKIALGEKRADFAFTLSGNELVRSQGGEIIPCAEFAIGCRITHLETEIGELEDGFESSSWLQAITGPVCAAALEPVYVPFPLFTFPEIPAMEEHTQVCAQEDFCCAYRFAFSNTVHYPQLQPQVKVRYNVPIKRQRRKTDDGLFTALARFDSVGAAVVADLQTSAEALCAVPGLPDTCSQDALTFAAAMDSLLTLMQELAVAPLTTVRREAEAGEELHFTLMEGIWEGALTITVYAPEVTRNETGLIVPEVGTGGYTPICISADAKGYTYVFEDAHKKLLPAAEGQLIKGRAVTLPPRKILLYRNALAEQFTEQNRFLIPGRESAPEFIFTTGAVTFPAPAAASAVISEEKDIRSFRVKGMEDTLKNCMDGLFAHYIGKAPMVTVQAECRYRREAGVGLPMIEQPIFLQTPVVITNGNTIALLRDWTDTVAKWRREFPVSRRAWLGTEGLHLRITFLDGGVPVLTLENCLYHGKPVIRREGVER